MPVQHYIVYVPGLGDGYDGGRKLALRFWRLWGVRIELVPMQWFDGGDYDSKFQRVTAAVKAAEEKGYRVTLIGESAGGSMAINVAAKQPSLHGLLTICGVNSPDAPVAASTLRKSPAFASSIRQLRESLPGIDTRKTQTLRAYSDPIVQQKYTVIRGTKNHWLPSVGHLTTIVLCLTLFSGYIVALLRRND